MIHELDSTEYEKVRALSRPLRYNLSSAAVLDGNNPSRIFVDDRANPQSVFTISPEGSYLAGRSDNRPFNQALTEAIRAGEIPGRKWQAFLFICHPEHWHEQIEAHLEPYPLLKMSRRHCPDDNIGSFRTAEKIGFEIERNYTMYVAYLSDKPG